MFDPFETYGLAPPDAAPLTPMTQVPGQSFPVDRLPASKPGLLGRMQPGDWARLGTALVSLLGGQRTYGLAAGAVAGSQQNLENRQKQQALNEASLRTQQDQAFRAAQMDASNRLRESQRQTQLAQERLRIYQLAKQSLAEATTPKEYDAAVKSVYAEAALIPDLGIRPGTFESLYPLKDKRDQTWAAKTLDANVKAMGGLDKLLAANPVFETPAKEGQPSQRIDAQHLMELAGVSAAMDPVSGKPVAAPADESPKVRDARAIAVVNFTARQGRKPDANNPADEKWINKESARLLQQSEKTAMGEPPAVSPDMQGRTGEQVLSGVDPAKADIVRKVANYQYPLPPGFAWRTPYWQEILGLVGRYDPTFDANQYQARLRLRQDATSGKLANNIRSLNTAIAHLDTLRKAGEQLDNTNWQPLNWVKNKLRAATGDPAIVQFTNAANAVAAEAATAFKGTAGTDQEIKTWHTGMSEIQSPAQIKGSIDTITELIAGRLNAIREQFEGGMGKPKDFHFLNDKSMKILSGMGVDVNQLDDVGVGSIGPSGHPKPSGKKFTIIGVS